MKMSLRSQLFYGLGLLLTLLISGFTYLIVSYQSNFLQEQRLKQAINRSQAVVTSVKVWVMTNDYIGLQEVVENFTKFEDLDYITIVNSDGKLIAHTDKQLTGKYIADQKRVDYLNTLKDTSSPLLEETNIFKNGKYLEVFRPIKHENTLLGFVHLRIDNSAYINNIKNTISQGLIFTLTSLLLAGFFIYYITSLLIRELLELGIVMRRVSHGERDVIANVDGAQEIAKLSSELNALTSNLKHSEELIAQLHERQKLALSANNDGVWDWDIQNQTIYLSDRSKEMLGYTESEFEDSLENWRAHIHPNDLAKRDAAIVANIKKESKYYQDVHRLRKKDGSWIWVLERGKTIFEGKRAVRMLGTHTDITKEKEQQMRYARQALILEQLHDSVIITNLNGDILSWNKGSEVIFGYTKEEVQDKNIELLYPADEYKSNREKIIQAIQKGSHNFDARLITKEQREIYLLTSLSILKDEEQSPSGLVYISQDITKRKAAQRELIAQQSILEYQANHDSLTGLANRTLFNTKLSNALVNAKKLKKRIALFFIDLDNFKEINDSLGHVVGDKVLQATAQKLLSMLNAAQTLVRLGGDEFILIIEDKNEQDEIASFAQQIIQHLSHPLSIDNHLLYITCSIGISLYPDDGDTVDNLLKYADSAMYKAKYEGRSTYKFYDVQMTKLALNRIAMESSLRNALIKRDEFVIYFQPQVDAQNDELIGMEALVRWQHPTLGFIAPSEFIPLAETTGLIVPLDRIVMHHAMIQLSKWYEQGLNPGILALNLSVQQINQSDFMEFLQATLYETHCKAEWIELEVTESQIMKNPKEAIKTLNSISALGVELAIDDFGTGYSSLSYLKKLPINKLKIDQSFVKDLPNNENDVGISKTVITLAKSLNLNIIAEGVETKEQKDFLVANGCKNVQGYFYSKPLSADDMTQLLQNGLTNKNG